MKKIIAEFREFISRGNVMDMAVGVIIGGAFTAIVNSLVENILNPLLGLITGGLDFSSLSVGIGEAQFKYGSFISAVINFLLIAMVLFSIIKLINKLHWKKKHEDAAPAEPTTKVCPFCQMEVSIKATRCPHCTSSLEENTEG